MFAMLLDSPHPQLDLIDELIRIVGWPTLIGAFLWASRQWYSGQQEVKEMAENTKRAVSGVAEVKNQVDLITNNHLSHLQDGILRLADSNDKAVVVLQDIKTGIAILADRDKR
jgi:hypothetical protein